MRLKDKVAIVTGGAHGMGASEARLFTAALREKGTVARKCQTLHEKCQILGNYPAFPG